MIAGVHFPFQDDRWLDDFKAEHREELERLALDRARRERWLRICRGARAWSWRALYLAVWLAIVALLIATVGQ